EERQRREEVLPQLTLQAYICLQALPPGVAQARVVLKTDVNVRLRAIVGVVGRPKDQEPLQVLGRLDIHAVLLVDGEPRADCQLCPGAVDETRADGTANLRP